MPCWPGLERAMLWNSSRARRAPVRALGDLAEDLLVSFDLPIPILKPCKLEPLGAKPIALRALSEQPAHLGNEAFFGVDDDPAAKLPGIPDVE